MNPRLPLPKTERAPIADADAIQNRIAKLLRRAFRKPVNTETLARFTKFAEDQLSDGASFEDTMRTVVGAVLGMPDFLYFYETLESSSVDGIEVRQPATAANAVGSRQRLLTGRQRR